MTLPVTVSTPTERSLLILHGNQAANEDVRAAVEARRSLGIGIDVRVTWEADDAARFVNEAVEAGYTHLVAGGGDGTLKMVAEALARTGSNASLALMPLGTANDFARAAGIPLDPAGALGLLDVPAQPIDMIGVDGQLFLNMATGGFGSQVTANTSTELKRALGGAAYLLTGLTRFAEVRAAFGHFKGPDFEWEGEFLAMGIGNGRQAGGGHVLCPQALANDGLLDLSILPTPQDLMGTLGSLMSGGFGTDELFIRARLPWVEVSAPEGLDMNLDGEPMHRDTVRFEVRPNALRLHMPINCVLIGNSPVALTSDTVS
ncbi:lipid kinase YegS [Pseudomonas duriflava]|uniref:Probable lipid kinase YegS-like n=1 Tax=Pseudomonas duriflava TaxID=459528 RepID=A0A562Q8G7_9PSED|nr:lipid kinase YegS [Pseudomonas duriflava]TWI53008.1 lipid kinase YegS [Pseudomonas duriflava]